MYLGAVLTLLGGLVRAMSTGTMQRPFKYVWGLMRMRILSAGMYLGSVLTLLGGLVRAISTMPGLNQHMSKVSTGRVL
jgi:hypothetical protein